MSLKLKTLSELTIFVFRNRKYQHLTNHIFIENAEKKKLGNINIVTWLFGDIPFKERCCLDHVTLLSSVMVAKRKITFIV